MFAIGLHGRLGFFRITSWRNAIMRNSTLFSHTAAKIESVETIQSPSFTGSESQKQYPAHIHDIVERISHLTLLEVADLTELLQKRLNITAPSPMMMMPTMAQMSANTQSTEKTEEQPTSVKTSYTVRLLKFDAAKKVQLIKEIKQLLPEMNLVQAKKFVEAAPGNIKADVSKEEAETIKQTLEAAGASIEIE